MEPELIDPRDIVTDDEDAWAPALPDDVDLVADVANLMAVLAAQRLQRIDDLRRNALADGGAYGTAIPAVIERSVRLELASALRITEHAAGMLLAQAEALVERYPAALDSLGRARMTERHAQVLVELLEGASEATRARLTTRAVELAEELPVGSFRRSLRRLIEVEESATLTERHERAVEDRRVLVEPAADGMAWLHALLPAVEAHALHGRITAMAKALTGRGADDGRGLSAAAEPVAPSGSAELDTRTLDQARADVLCDLLIEGSMAAHPGVVAGIRASVAVTVPALALLAHDDAARHAEGIAPATVEGLGPVPLGVAKELCGGADEGWMRVLTHPETGMVLSIGRTRYRPPASLRRLVRWRADRCMAPGCGIPADRCQIDHNIAWEHGGSTALNNHAPLCQGHHTIKHHGGWTIEQLADEGGALLWTSPTGRRYLVRPERPVFASGPTFRPGSGRTQDAPF
ncbi:DUF222 domain-containing protein [Microbacterium insulae]|uniref:DUF222 domain-containing protein n=1 Tax=Microbacterium insulae TaxID=483014 RepID=A0ABW3ALN5_9MICO